MPAARLTLFVLITLTALTRPLSATWSIILVDTRTGEIGVACATCLSNLDLQRLVPVLIVERGAACAQSFVDPSGQNRALIHDSFQFGVAPNQILSLLAQRDPSHQTRQYGIVDVQGRAVGFSGTQNGAFAGNLTGRSGDIVYAIQGNVITGAPVLTAAEQAILNTPGDLGEKLMAAMEAARMMGGDGRCSCSNSAPTSCGAPPPSFSVSALIGFMIVARAGDIDGTCGSAAGCANGDYYFNSNFTSGGSDPVFRMRTAWDQFKVAARGRPDHLLSVVDHPTTLPADGSTTRTIRVRLRDREGTALTSGGATLNVSLEPSSATVSFGQVVDNGDGTYDVPVTAGGGNGEVAVRIAIPDGSREIVLMPRPRIRLVDDALWTDTRTLSVGAGGTADFVLQPGLGSGGRPFVLVASASGTTPGTRIAPGVTLPLNNDAVLQATLLGASTGAFPNLTGSVSSDLTARASLTLPRGGYGLPIGLDLDFAYAVLQPIDRASNAVRIRTIN